MEKLAEAVTRLAVLEERYQMHSTALDRAFVSIDKAHTDIKAHQDEDVRKHSSIDRKSSFVLGIAMAISAVWTMFGGYLMTSLAETNRAVETFKIHIIEDRVKTGDDVRAIR